MVMAHMDQIGMTVRRIDENGFLRVSKVGGMFEPGVINQRVKVRSSEEGEITGVVGMRPPHLDKGDDKRSIPEMKDLFVDIGAEDEEDAKDAGVRVGDYIHYDRNLEEMENGMLTGPAFDDRVGCAVLIEAFNEYDGDVEFVAVFSVQEEVGTKGAKTSTFSVDPDVALAVDVGMAGDTPGIEPDESDDSIGDGVGIDLVQAGGRGLIAPESVRTWLLETSEKKDINYYRALYDGGATDAASIELQRDGIPTGSLGVPLRNMHSPIEVVSPEDMEQAVDLVVESAGTLHDYFE